MRENKLLKALVGAAGYVGLLFAASSAAVLVFIILKTENDRIVSIVSAVFSIAAACLWLRHKNRDILLSLSVRSVPVRELLLIIGAAAAATLLVQCLQFAFPAGMRMGFAGEVLSGSLPLDIACLMIAAPVAEEIFFRALIIPALSNGMGKIAAVIVSSAAFAVMHDGIVWVLMAFCISLFYSYVFIRTNSVISCVAAHMTSNMLAIIYHLLFA